jgi:hypothetical protein
MSEDSFCRLGSIDDLKNTQAFQCCSPEINN